jgi:hypothetical protein
MEQLLAMAKTTGCLREWVLGKDDIKNLREFEVIY